MSTSNFHQSVESNRRHDVEAKKLTRAICSLYMLEEDPYLKVMAWNVSVLDRSLFDLESKIVENLPIEKSNEIEMLFLTSQTIMWLDLVYELLTTWEERVQKVKLFLSANLSKSIRPTMKEIGTSNIEDELIRLEKSLSTVHISLSLIELLQQNKKELKTGKEDGSLEYRFSLDDGGLSRVSRRNISSSLLKFEFTK